MPAEIHQVEDVLLETAATEAGPGIEEFRTNPTVGANRPATSRTSAPLASQNAAMELIELIRCAKGIGRELELTAPNGAQDLLLGHQLA